MILRINVGTDEAPEWVNADAENAQFLNGLTLNDILNTATMSADSAVEEAEARLRREIVVAVKKYDPSAWLTEDATTEDIVKYFVQK